MIDALQDASSGVGQPHVLAYGEGLITADEQEIRQESFDTVTR